MKKALFLLVLFTTIQGFSQALNSYKYLIVPAKFEFQKQENQYGLNSLMEAYFKQQGFTVVYDKNMMKESSINPCEAIYANIIRENSMFNTRITVQLKNCEDKSKRVACESPKTFLKKASKVCCFLLEKKAVFPLFYSKRLPI